MPLQQDADGEGGEDRDQEVTEAAPVADQGPGRARDDPGEHDQDQGRFVQTERRDGGGGAEPPRQPDAGHGETHAPEGFLGRCRPPAEAQPPPGA